jgi:hypothetical protein
MGGFKFMALSSEYSNSLQLAKFTDENKKQVGFAGEALI